MKRLSIKLRLMLWTAVVTALITLLTGSVYYHFLKKSLYQHVDRTLEEAASVVMIEVEAKNGQVHHEWKDSLEKEELAKTHTYIQVRDLNSGAIESSSNLEGFELDVQYGALGERVFYDLTLPNGEMGRAIGVLMYPRVEYRAGNEGFDPSKHPQAFVRAESSAYLQSILAQARLMFGLGGVAVVGLLWCGIWVVVHFSFKESMAMIDAVLAREGSSVGEPLSIPDSLPVEMVGVALKYNELLSKIDASREKDRDFFLNIAHEIRTPIAGLHAINEQALRKERSKEDYRQRFEEAVVESKNLNQLVNRLMQFGQLRRIGKVLDLAQVDAHDVLKRVWSAFQQRASERELDVQWVLCTSGEFRSDEELLKVIASNLVENAVNYALPASCVKMVTLRDEQHWALQISNEVAAEEYAELDVSRFFDPFFRADRARNQERNHVGLGLSFSLEVAKLLGGELRVEKCSKNRVVFELRVPVHA